MENSRNIQRETVDGFGREWESYDQSEVDQRELESIFKKYFGIFPLQNLSKDESIGFDMGCGSGRWANFIAPKVKKLHCIDASQDALAVARGNLSHHDNCEFSHASVAEAPLQNDSMDFGYSLGVLHHVPDTKAGIQSCVNLLKPGAPFLIYLYYAFDQRPEWFKRVWKLSDVARKKISKLPFPVKKVVTETIALTVYFPLAKGSMIAEKVGMSVDHFPLSAYRDQSFYTMRTDAMDRFGTQLEQRFTRPEIKDMMEACGLEKITFSESEPYWCAIGFKK